MLLFFKYTAYLTCLSQVSSSKDLAVILSATDCKWQALHSLQMIHFGLGCRSVVAEAMFNRLLQRMQDSSAPLLASVESASLGPSFEEHDPRVVRLAREAGLQLGRKTQRSFDEIRDPVDYDLIVAMDRFDFEEVLTPLLGSYKWLALVPPQ